MLGILLFYSLNLCTFYLVVSSHIMIFIQAQTHTDYGVQVLIGSWSGLKSSLAIWVTGSSGSDPIYKISGSDLIRSHVLIMLSGPDQSNKLDDGSASLDSHQATVGTKVKFT